MTAKPFPATASEATDPSWWGALLVGAILFSPAFSFSATWLPPP